MSPTKPAPELNFGQHIYYQIIPASSCNVRQVSRRSWLVRISVSFGWPHFLQCYYCLLGLSKNSVHSPEIIPLPI